MALILHLVNLLYVLKVSPEQYCCGWHQNCGNTTTAPIAVNCHSVAAQTPNLFRETAKDLCRRALELMEGGAILGAVQWETPCLQSAPCCLLGPH